MCSPEKNPRNGIPDEDLGCRFHAGLLTVEQEKAVVNRARKDRELTAELTLIAAVGGSLSKMWHLLNHEDDAR